MTRLPRTKQKSSAQSRRASAWSLAYEGFDPAQEGLREALCTLGNGYLATRGAAPESEAGETHYPGTYLAGGYNRLTTEIAGREVENEDLVNLPNWLPLTFRIDEENWFNPMAVEILDYHQQLDLKRGLLLRTMRFRHSHGRQTRLSQRRLVHMRNPHLAALECTLTAENWSGRMEILSALDGRVVNAGVERYRNLNSTHLSARGTRVLDGSVMVLKAETTQSEVRIAEAARTLLYRNGKPLAAERTTREEPGYIAQQFTVDLKEGKYLSIEKVVAVATSRDHAISECGLRAERLALDAGRFSELLRSHVLAWRHAWSRFDIEIERSRGDDETRMEMILRLYSFHLLQTVSAHTIDLDVGVPARGWHGEAYRGHIFWDELFIFPLLNLRVPEITRSLLKYRYRRLDRARLAAREAGYRGAMFPWQSGSTGREESQRVHLNPRSGHWVPDNSSLQRHVNAAIAYNAWRYYQVTQDLEFLHYTGAEMIFSIARFWASIASYNPQLRRYEILGAMGPDEYHDSYPGSDKPGVDNNAYTNIMAVWVLTTALELLHLLPRDRREELSERLGIDDDELHLWQDVSRRMRVVFHDDGIISQFEGYDQLEEFPWEDYRNKYVNIQRLDRILEAEGDTPNRYKASKQADVLMLFYLLSAEELTRIFERLGYPFEHDTIPQNIDYYMHRTSHGSTLSWVVHAWVLARSDRVRSWQLFTEALESDVGDIQGGTTPEGIHLGAMAGTVDLLQRGSTGIETRGAVLWFNPRLPEELGRLSLRIRYRGHSLKVEVTHDKLKIVALRSAAGPITIGFNEKLYEIREGARKEFPL